MLTSVKAAELFGVTNDYITQLCRKGKVAGVLQGRVWMVDEASVRQCIESARARRAEQYKNLRTQPAAALAPAPLPVAAPVALPLVPVAPVAQAVAPVAPVAAPAPVRARPSIDSRLALLAAGTALVAVVAVNVSVLAERRAQAASLGGVVDTVLSWFAPRTVVQQAPQQPLSAAYTAATTTASVQYIYNTTNNTTNNYNTNTVNRAGDVYNTFYTGGSVTRVYRDGRSGGGEGISQATLDSSLAGYLAISGGTLTGALAGTSATFDSLDVDTAVLGALSADTAEFTNATTTTFALLGAGEGCAQFDANGVLTSTGTLCGTGSGGGADGNWTFFNTSAIRLATTSNQVVIGASATSTKSKVQIVGGLTVDNATTTQATTTNLAISGITSGLLATNAQGSVVATTTLATAYLSGSLATLNGQTLSAGGTLTITAASSTLLANDNTFSGTNVFSNTISGSITGNAGTVTNGVYTTTFNSLFDPRFITQLAATTSVASITTLPNLSLPYSQLTGAPAAVGFPFIPTTNYGAAAVSTSTPVWFTAGLQASSTSHFAQASTTLLTTPTAYIAQLANLASAGFVKTDASGTLSIDTNTYLTSLAGAASSTILADNNTWSGTNVFSNTISGSISGNAGTVTNGVYTTTFGDLFDNRLSASSSIAGITTLPNLSLPYSQLTGAPTISGYPFALTGNATSTLTQFNGGLTAFASTTIGNGTASGGLTISGSATTTNLRITSIASGRVPFTTTGGLLTSESIFTYNGGTLTASTFNSDNGFYVDGSLVLNGDLTNVYAGTNAAGGGTPGISDTAVVGYNSLFSILSGNRNAALGSNTLHDLTVGTGNVALGYMALKGLVEGDENIAIGSLAGNGQGTGTNNIIIGANAETPNNLGSNQLSIGNLLLGTLPTIPTQGFHYATTGTIGVGTTSPTARFGIALNHGGTLTTAFQISSSTANATTTLFSISNTGLASTTALTISSLGASAGQCLTTSASGAVTSTSCGGGGLTGTVGQVAYFSGTDTAVGTSSLYLSTAGNVGIGTTTPTTKLTVHGNTAGVDGVTVVNANASGQATYTVSSDTATGYFRAYGSGIGYGLGGNTSFGSNSGLVLFTNGNVTSGGSDSIQFRTGGYESTQERMRITSAGNVGIGTSTPSAKLDVYGGNISLTNSVPQIQLIGTEASGKNIGLYEYQGTFNIDWTGNATLFTANGNTGNITMGTSGLGGNVGIGTSSPQHQLHNWISSASQLNTALENYGTGGAAYILRTNNTASRYFGVEGSTPYKLHIGAGQTVGSSAWMTMDAGLVGIGTTSPFARLSVHAAAGETSFAVGSSTGTNFVVDSSGNVGIGTATPTTKLHLYNATADSTVVASFQNDARRWSAGVNGVDVFRIADNTAGADRLTIATSGNVGLGTTTPQSILSVVSGTNGTLNFPAGGWAVQIYNQNDSSTSGGLVVGNRWLDNASTVFEAGSLYGTGSTWSSFLVVKGAGNVGIGTTDPNSKLEIKNAVAKATTAQTSNLWLSSSDASNALTLHGGIGSHATAGNRYTYLQSEDQGVAYRALALNPAGGNVGIGTTTPSGALAYTVNAVVNHGWFGATNGGGFTNRIVSQVLTGGTGLDVYDQNGSNSSMFPFTVSNNTGAGASRAVLFAVNGAGNVGIGTTSPARKLSVVADATGIQPTILQLASQSGPDWESLDLGYNNTLNYGYIQATTYNVSWDSLALNPNGGNVGVGTSTPRSKLTISGASSQYGTLSVWAPSGNSTDSVFQVFRDSNPEISAFNILRSGNVGVGTSTPGHRLTLADNSVLAIGSGAYTSSSNWIKLWRGDTAPTYSLEYGSIGVDFSGVSGQEMLNIGGRNVGFRYGAGTLGMVLNASGNVGVGTSTPGASLEVHSTGTSFPAGYNSNLRLAGQFPGFWLQDWSSNNGYMLGQDSGLLTFWPTSGTTVTNSVPTITLNQSGNVGIGTTTPTGPLHVVSSVPYLVADDSTGTTGFVALGGSNAVGHLMFDSSGSLSISSQPYGSRGTNSGETARLTIDGSGYVGIGSAPIAGRMLTSYDSASGGIAGNFINAHNSFTGSSIVWAETYTTQGTGWYGYYLRSDVDGTPDVEFYVRGDGATFADGAYSGAGADYAEYVTPAPGTDPSDYPKGSLLCLVTSDPDTYGYCDSQNDNHVLGAISTAPAVIGNSPALATSSMPREETHILLAMLGRVPLRVNLEGGDIKIGDRLAASSVPGVAMKATTTARTVGFALEEHTAANPAAGGKVLMYLGPELTFAPGTLDAIGEIVAFATASTTPAEGSFMAGFIDNLFSRLVAWFGDAANGIGDMVAGSFRARDTICVDDQCLTRDDVAALLALVGQQNSGGNGGGADEPPAEEPPVEEPPAEEGGEEESPADEGGEDPAPEPEPQPEPQPAPEPEPTPEPQE